MSFSSCCCLVFFFFGCFVGWDGDREVLELQAVAFFLFLLLLLFARPKKLTEAASEAAAVNLAGLFDLGGRPLFFFGGNVAVAIAVAVAVAAVGGGDVVGIVGTAVAEVVAPLDSLSDILSTRASVLSVL